MAGDNNHTTSFYKPTQPGSDPIVLATYEMSARNILMTRSVRP